MQKLQGFTEVGNTTLTISGAAGTITRKVQGSFPSCTVTVYNAGTVTIATIYSDNGVTPKANPFTAAADGTWFFYGEGRFDVQFSGSGFTTFTLGDFLLSDADAFAWVNVLSTGAKGDGLTDDTAAIQKAVDSLPITTGGTVFFPARSYLVKDIVVSTPYVCFLGSGFGEYHTQLVSTGTVTSVIKVAAPGFTMQGIQLVGNGRTDGTYGGTIDGLQLDGTSNPNGDAKIERCQFIYFNRPIYSSVKNYTIRDNVLTGSIYGIYIDDPSDHDCRGYQIQHNEFHGCGNATHACIYSPGSSGGVHEVVIQNNYFSAKCDTAVDLTGAYNIIISDNILSKGHNDAFVIRGGVDGITVTGNQILGKYHTVNLTRVGTTVTVTLVYPTTLFLLPGDLVVIAGATDANYNGVQTVVTTTLVPGSANNVTAFTYTASGVPAGNENARVCTYAGNGVHITGTTTNVLVADNEMTYLGESGVKFDGAVTDSRIANNVFYSTGQQGTDAAIYLGANTDVVTVDGIDTVSCNYSLYSAQVGNTKILNVYNVRATTPLTNPWHLSSIYWTGSLEWHDYGQFGGGFYESKNTRYGPTWTKKTATTALNILNPSQIIATIDLIENNGAAIVETSFGGEGASAGIFYLIDRVHLSLSGGVLTVTQLGPKVTSTADGASPPNITNTYGPHASYMTIAYAYVAANKVSVTLANIRAEDMQGAYTITAVGASSTSGVSAAAIVTP